MSTRPCPSGTLTRSQCDKVPNASWDSGAQVCVCCSTNGNSYASNGVCLSCPLDSECGDNRYCKGKPVDRCVQNKENFKWSVRECTSCSGTCDVSCGFLNEWFLFQDCLGTTNKKCQATVSQWKSWVTYGGLLLFLILVGLLIWWFARRSKKDPAKQKKNVQRGRRACDYPIYNRISGYFPARPEKKKEFEYARPFAIELDERRAFSP